MKNEKRIRKVVLAYSGGLDTSVIIPWLKETYGAEVIAFVADLGQEEPLEAIRKKALRTGASKCYVEDLREEFVRDFVFPAYRANAIYEGQYLLGTSIARPLIAKRQVEIARKEKADAISHGSTGKGNDQVRFELTAYALEPGIRIIAPWREWDLRGRSDLIAYAAARRIPVPVTAAKPYSSDRNLLHISYEGGILEEPWAEAPKDIFAWTTDPEDAPDRAETLDVGFEEGNPVSVDGRHLSPARLLHALNQAGARHGVGRTDLVESRFVGMKVRGVYETPGGTILRAAHRAVESLTLDREVLRIQDRLVPDYSALVYNGFWYSPDREILQTTVDEIQKAVTGTARVRLYKGSCAVIARKAPKSLFDPALASFEAESVSTPRDSEGFIRTLALRLRVRARRGLGPKASRR